MISVEKHTILKAKAVAIRREIITGIKNPDYIQVLSGLEAGEKVIIPKQGMSVFHNSSSVVINN